MRNCITIFTDASLCTSTGAAGWGAWVKYGDGKTLQFSGAMKDTVKTSDEAELKAIVNALYMVTKHLFIAPGTLIAIITDSASAIVAIEKYHQRRNGIRKRDFDRIKHLHDIAGQIHSLCPSGCELSIRKVKAHVKKANQDNRTYVNCLVDRLAKEQMLKKRSEINAINTELDGF